jgi:hypothetical protein
MRYLLSASLITLIAEIATSWWKWARAPTDGLRVYYRGNFAAYAVERLVPWLIIFASLWVIFLIFDRRRTKRLKEMKPALKSATQL